MRSDSVDDSGNGLGDGNDRRPLKAPRRERSPLGVSGALALEPTTTAAADIVDVKVGAASGAHVKIAPAAVSSTLQLSSRMGKGPFVMSGNRNVHGVRDNERDTQANAAAATAAFVASIGGVASSTTKPVGFMGARQSPNDSWTPSGHQRTKGAQRSLMESRAEVTVGFEGTGCGGGGAVLVEKGIGAEVGSSSCSGELKSGVYTVDPSRPASGGSGVRMDRGTEARGPVDAVVGVPEQVCVCACIHKKTLFVYIYTYKLSPLEYQHQ